MIDTQNTYLYLILGGGKAMRYGIGVGREGFTWAGAERVSRMAEWPDWHPPSEMIERQPYLPRFMAGGEGNPLGARALYLGKTLYRIHGTNQPSTIGTFVSSGCIRLTNEDITDLYYRVKVGTRVVVLPGKPPATASAPADGRRSAAGAADSRPRTTSRSRCSRRRLSRRAESVSQHQNLDARPKAGHLAFGEGALAARWLRRVAPADGRLADAEAGQFPDAGAAGVLVGADVGVDQVRLAGGDRLRAPRRRGRRRGRR